MTELIKDKRIKILLHFIKLENENFFMDKRLREYGNVVRVMNGHLAIEEKTVRTILNDLIDIEVITREHEKSVKHKNKYVSLLYYKKNNKFKLKEMYDNTELVKYVNDEFNLLILR